MAPLRVRLALVALALVLPGIVPSAGAAYGPGSEVEADAPILLAGRTDALAPQGYAGFVSDDARASLKLTLRADEAFLRHLSLRTCQPAATDPRVPCIPTTGSGPRPDEATLEHVTVTLERVTSAFKVVATNDPAHADSSSYGAPGSLVASASAGTLVGATARPLHLSPYGASWEASEPRALTDDVYTVGASESQLSALGGSVQARRGFEVLLQGVVVRVEGTDEDGAPFSRTFDTTTTDDEVRFLVLEVSDGELLATSTAPLQAFSVSTIDAHGSANMAKAKGTIRQDGRTVEHDGTAGATLPGPVSLVLTKVVAPAREGQPYRMAFALSSNLRVLQELGAPPEDGREPLQLVAAGVAGASVASLLAAAVYFWPRLKFAGALLFLPLYSRIERTSVLEHGKRDEIYELIRTSPGIHAHEIGEKAQIGWGTTVYHLKLLEQHSLVVSKKSGRYKRFFVNTGEYTKKKDVYGALRNDTAKAVADYIVNHPGCSQKDLCAAVGIQPSLASWHVDKLEGVELVKRVKDGRQVRYYAGPAWESLNVRVMPGGGVDTPVET